MYLAHWKKREHPGKTYAHTESMQTPHRKTLLVQRSPEEHEQHLELEPATPWCKPTEGEGGDTLEDRQVNSIKGSEQKNISIISHSGGQTSQHFLN